MWIFKDVFITLTGKILFHHLENCFTIILRQIQNSEKQWKQWFDKEAPEEAVVPNGYEDSLRVFHRLLLVRCWCPDRTLKQVWNRCIVYIWFCEKLYLTNALQSIKDLTKGFQRIANHIQNFKIIISTRSLTIFLLWEWLNNLQYISLFNFK